ncbi:MAG: cob(I)yrinic acid a,c-diamide adenosyltransferase [Patescibacteria group bacterium]|nr:cob(I)yrinic acid a,c-diamide adenosyltransferase [Patescibacteria group bacterium]MCL5095745.1 cob(I)yrinic acid a,c-diamide adenosyltransferase [Patescibacteria group bacterium]
MIIVYTGNGKGKTTAALGLALRAAGWGKKVLVIQFLKKQVSGEVKALYEIQKKFQISNFKFQIDVEQYGTKDFVNPKRLKPVDYKEAKKALESSKYQVLSSKYELIILDEINVAVKFGLIKLEDVLQIINDKPKKLDLVLTGRFACPEIIRKADLVTEFTEVSHPFQKGEKARKGIDY